jgi:hypothetical protein
MPNAESDFCGIDFEFLSLNEKILDFWVKFLNKNIFLKKTLGELFITYFKLNAFLPSYNKTTLANFSTHSQFFSINIFQPTLDSRASKWLKANFSIENFP